MILSNCGGGNLRSRGFSWMKRRWGNFRWWWTASKQNNRVNTKCVEYKMILIISHKLIIALTRESMGKTYKDRLKKGTGGVIRRINTSGTWHHYRHDDDTSDDNKDHSKDAWRTRFVVVTVGWGHGWSMHNAFTLVLHYVRLVGWVQVKFERTWFSNDVYNHRPLRVGNRLHNSKTENIVFFNLLYCIFNILE